MTAMLPKWQHRGKVLCLMPLKTPGTRVENAYQPPAITPGGTASRAALWPRSFRLANLRLRDTERCPNAYPAGSAATVWHSLTTEASGLQVASLKYSAVKRYWPHGVATLRLRRDCRRRPSDMSGPVRIPSMVDA